MADVKITALAVLTAADPINDAIPIVDVSDTTMAASGTTKRISVNNILGASGTATLASATITGDLTAARLIVTGGTIPTNGLWLPTTNTLEFAANSLAQYRIAPLGVFSWYDGAGGTRMTLNSTGLGVGVTPSAGRGAIQLSAGVGFPATQVASSDANCLDDYEEGTFVPTILFGSGAVGVVYAQNFGIYTKVGRIVHFSGRVDLSNKGSSTGSATIQGLPFNANIGAASVGFQQSAAPSGGQLMLTISSTLLTLRYANGTSTSESTDANFANNSIIIFSGTYAI
jgi:hypothetical protein